jgi:signal transduction histidine kinase
LTPPVKEGGCVVVLHDVTRFKQLERVKDEFIATASHDLRNPITAIKGFSQLIKQVGPTNEAQNDFIQRIQNATVNMNELVENMMDLAKFGLGIQKEFEELSINQLLRELVDEFQPQAEAKRQLLTIEKTESNLKVRGDALQLHQALHNLIGNAIKYTPAGGAIDLSVETEEATVLIHVRNTGHGIPAEDLPHIFERFYRVHNNGHDQIEGNGLGPAIVKSIVEQHDAQINVESKQNKGSCFHVSIPLLATSAKDSSDTKTRKNAVILKQPNCRKDDKYQQKELKIRNTNFPQNLL